VTKRTKGGGQKHLCPTTRGNTQEQCAEVGWEGGRNLKRTRENEHSPRSKFVPLAVRRGKGGAQKKKKRKELIKTNKEGGVQRANLKRKCYGVSSDT